MPHAPRPASCFLPRAHFIPGLAFSELVLGFGSQDSPLHQCPDALCLRAKDQRPQPVPQAHLSGQAGSVLLRSGLQAGSLLEDLAQEPREKHENPTKKRPPQGMKVWVPSPWWPLAGAAQLRGKDKTGTVLLPYRKSQAPCWGLLVLRSIVSMLAFVRVIDFW